MNAAAKGMTLRDGPLEVRPAGCADAEERRRARGYPISRWCLRPLAGRLAAILAPSRVRPVHLTLCGLVASAAAAGLLVLRPELGQVAAGLVLLAWFFDRADGQLARRQGTASAWGAWLDGNVDELADVGLHAAVAWAAAAETGSTLPWVLLVGFFGGKYLFMHGLYTSESEPSRRVAGTLRVPSAEIVPRPVETPPNDSLVPLSGERHTECACHFAYHLPGNADVRVHLLALALATGWLTAELAVVAGYYNLRWMVRYGLVARRLGGGQ